MQHSVCEASEFFFFNHQTFLNETEENSEKYTNEAASFFLLGLSNDVMTSQSTCNDFVLLVKIILHADMVIFIKKAA